MEYIEILRGEGEPLSIYDNIVKCLENEELFPYLIETIYREALSLVDDGPDRLRFALIRLQVWADLHRYQDMEQAQKMKYIAQGLEKVVFGNLLLEYEEAVGE
jgi:hypothetical protein